jgi:L-amino acid N-acyltransferase YncA
MPAALLPAAPARVRPATARDLDAIAAIFAHYVTTSVITFEECPPTAADWQRQLGRLAERRLPFLVADVAGAVAGYAYASPWRPQPAYRHTAEDSVYLAPDRRGRGLGRLLLDGLLDQCAAAGLRQVIAVIADTGDPASLALHRACGFADAGRLREVGDKHGRRIDTVLLQRALSAGGARLAPGRPQFAGAGLIFVIATGCPPVRPGNRSRSREITPRPRGDGSRGGGRAERLPCLTRA